LVGIASDASAASMIFKRGIGTCPIYTFSAEKFSLG
jgi:hypothetical protein